MDKIIFTSVLISWNEVPGAKGYRIQWGNNEQRILPNNHFEIIIKGLGINCILDVKISPIMEE